jgi:hypothetical protein
MLHLSFVNHGYLNKLEMVQLVGTLWVIRRLIARFVAGGHMTKTPMSITYSSVVSRDSVRIAFLIITLNDLDIMACDVSNAYLNALCGEKIWFVAGPEFGSRQGQVVKIIHVL